MSTFPMSFTPVANKIWLDRSTKFVEDEDREYYVIAKERLTAIAEGYPYLLPDGFRFAPLQNRKTYPFPYEIVLPDGKVVKTDNPDTAELNARIAEAAINQRYGIVSTPTAATTTTPTATTPEPTPAPSVVIPESSVNTSAPSVVIPESSKQSPLQVPTDFAQAQAEAEANDEKSSLIVGGLVLLGGFLIIRYLRKKK